MRTGSLGFDLGKVKSGSLLLLAASSDVVFIMRGESVLEELCDDAMEPSGCNNGARSVILLFRPTGGASV